jgi:hypothetical protein
MRLKVFESALIRSLRDYYRNEIEEDGSDESFIIWLKDCLIEINDRRKKKGAEDV